MRPHTRYYAVFATDKPGMRDVRERERAVHRTYLRSASQRGVFVRLGGSTLAPHCDALNGTLLVIEAEGYDDVMRFVRDDPYTLAGLFERVEIRPWDWNLGNPEQRV
ncbi:YciI family protein [Paraburkholderia silvatlantica]|uniref:YciI family protein n=1 Tax=Paraburkholderia silvatlantica TaxID=321895 RepID=UPI0037502173